MDSVAMTDEFDSLLGLTASQPPNNCVSADALGDMIGISGRQIRELARRNIVVKAGTGTYEVRASVRAYCTHLREQAAGRTGSKTLTEERIRVAKEQGDALAMKNAIARGEMIPARAIETAWAAVLRDVRAALLAIPSRIQQRLGHLTAHDVSEIDLEIRNALKEAAQ
jgi:phage terminase Nu1 subunit (DNA packaging protein)